MENINIVVLNSSTFLGLDKIIKEIIGYDNLSVCISDIDSFAYGDKINTSVPDVVWINTNSRDLMKQDVDSFYSTLESVWSRIPEDRIVVQNNFEFCRHSISSKKVIEINQKIESRSRAVKNFYLCDINKISNKIGLQNWYNDEYWYSFKIPYDRKYIPDVVNSLKRIISKANNDIKKCLVLDLDNTLWGGVIGDDGLEGIKIGRDDPIGEAYSDFQKYVKGLPTKGVLLAVCSKNNLEIAKSGFSHPDSILSLEDFVSFEASWDPKHLSIIKISEELNLGLNSFVFLDDNPAERDIVRRNLPQVEVPEVENVVDFIQSLEDGDYFNLEGYTEDDRKRSQFYKDNAKRKELRKSIGDYSEYLKSLNMKGEVRQFNKIYSSRISQLSRRTNQFNLTTRRFAVDDILNLCDNRQYITLYGRLKDKFGDNGLISALVGKKENSSLNIELWVMSCRVFNRDFELAMFDELISTCKQNKITKIVGTYIRTEKNKFVENLYQTLGFHMVNRTHDNSLWEYNIPEVFRPMNKFVEVESEHI
jgi:FkbH-like protein